MIKISGLAKEYVLNRENTVRALAGVDLDIDAGEVVALVGPSGSGKSSLLNVLGGLDRDYQGTVVVAGKDLKEYKPDNYRREFVGTIFQQFHLMPELSVVENIKLPNIFSGKYNRKQLKNRVEELLEKVGLEDRAKHTPAELSGGQAQRVAIARALIANPKILLADEPTGNLDTQTGQDIIDLMFKINKEEGTTMIVVTHDLEVISQIDKKIFLRDGKVETK